MKDKKKIEIDPKTMKSIMNKKSKPMNKNPYDVNKIIRCEECPYNDNECGGVRCPTIDEWQCLQYHFKKKHEQEIEELKLKIEKLEQARIRKFEVPDHWIKDDLNE